MSGRRIRVAQYVFVAIGIAALGYCAAVWIGAAIFQVRTAREFAKPDQSEGPVASSALASKQSAPLPAPILSDGGVVGRLSIPRLGVSVTIVEGVGGRDLRRAVGHIPGTSLPGQPGNVAIAGHRDTFFRPLRSIRPNDAITVSTSRGAYHYRVVSTKIVGPDDVQVLYPTGHDALTLVTCFPFSYFGAAPRRFIVKATRG